MRKSEVYNKLRSNWLSINDPEIIVKQLSEYQNAFLDVVRGSNLQEHSKEVYRGFKLLHDSDAPSSTYPFLMQLSNALKINTVESVCGHEPTGLHAVFKRLWVDCNGVFTPDNVISNIRRHKTVVWPSDDDVKNAILKRPLCHASITPFVISEWNKGLGGDQPNVKPWIEHVLPEKPAEEWLEVFTREQHEQVKDLLANLLPLSREMNQSLSNGPYEKKRPIYQEDSAFKAARRFAEEHAEWNPRELLVRSERLADWAVSRWKG